MRKSISLDQVWVPLFIGACLLLASRSAVYAAGADAQLMTEDTWAHVEVRDNHLYLTGLRQRQSNRNWIFNSAGGAPGEPIPIPLLSEATVGGNRVDLAWQYAGSSFLDGVPRRHVFSFVCTTLPLELRSIWKAGTGPGPIEHTISITNRGTQSIVAPLQTTLTFGVDLPADRRCEQWWVEKGANRPTAVGTHRSSISSSYAAELVSGPYAREAEHERDPIPWTAVQDIDNAEGWYSGVEFSGNVHIGLRMQNAGQGSCLVMDAGLSTDMRNIIPYSTRILPGTTFETPTVFVGCYLGDVDAGANRLHRWIETSLRPPVHDANYPLLVGNTWGYQTNIDARLVRSVTDDAVKLGLEMVHIDAGWYHSVGDWQPDPVKFPDGIAPLADYAHSKGLKFGLWVGWTQGGIARGKQGEPIPLSVDNPAMTDWFTHDYPLNWKPEPFTGADVCLADPSAVTWSINTLERIVRDYRIDLLEHDQRMIVDQCTRADHLHTEAPTDIAYRSTLGYNQVYDSLRGRHPGLLFEDCVNGGHTVDYGIVQRTHYVSITDTYDPLSNRRAFYDASYALPPAMCECYVDNQPCKTVDEFRAMLRSGMMGWCTIMCDTMHWAPEMRDAAKRQFVIYKTWLRPLIVSGDLFHVSNRPDGVNWDGMEYYLSGTGRGVLFAFRGTSDETEHLFRCKGLEPTAQYRVTYEDRSGVPLVRTGAELMNAGIGVRLAAPQTSELIYLERVTKG